MTPDAVSGTGTGTTASALLIVQLADCRQASECRMADPRFVVSCYCDLRCWLCLQVQRSCVCMRTLTPPTTTSVRRSVRLVLPDAPPHASQTSAELRCAYLRKTGRALFLVTSSANEGCQLRGYALRCAQPAGCTVAGPATPLTPGLS